MAFVIDVVACHTVGWWISRTADAAVALAALELPLNQHRPNKVTASCTVATGARNTWRPATPGCQPRQASSHPSAASALATTTPWPRRSNALFKAALSHRRAVAVFAAAELATLGWANGFNTRRLLEPIGNIPPTKADARCHAQAEIQALAA